MILDAGYHDKIPMADYVADPAPEPSLSTQTVHDLFYRSPMRARLYHPRLGGLRHEASPRGDLGSAIHSLAIGGDHVVFAPPEFEDWRKKAAQEFRDAARERGEIPLLERQRNEVVEASLNAREALGMFGPGRAEQTMIWQLENGAWCRGRADWLTDDGLYDVDIKTCENADEAEWARRCIESQGLDIQAALRCLGHHRLTGSPRQMLWLLIETEPPFEATVVGLSEKRRELACAKIDRAAKLWREALDSGIWPGRARRIYMADAPAYAELDVMERIGGGS